MQTPEAMNQLLQPREDSAYYLFYCFTELFRFGVTG